MEDSVEVTFTGSAQTRLGNDEFSLHYLPNADESKQFAVHFTAKDENGIILYITNFYSAEKLAAKDSLKQLLPIETDMARLASEHYLAGS